jgi:hypothetical protein
MRACSSCGHHKFRRVRREGIVDGLMVLLKLYPWECESCQRKTYSRRREMQQVKSHHAA